MLSSKKWSVLLVLVLIASVLAACAQEEPAPTVEPQPVATEAPVVVPTEATAESATPIVAATEPTNHLDRSVRPWD